MVTEIRMTDRKRTMIFINIVITCIASSMLATALTTALPAIISDLEISVTAGQWLTSGYSLAMGIIMPLTAFFDHAVSDKTAVPDGNAVVYCGAFFVRGCA